MNLKLVPGTAACLSRAGQAQNLSGNNCSPICVLAAEAARICLARGVWHSPGAPALPLRAGLPAAEPRARLQAQRSQRDGRPLPRRWKGRLRTPLFEALPLCSSLPGGVQAASCALGLDGS